MPLSTKPSLLCFAQPVSLEASDGDGAKVYDGDDVAAAYLQYARTQHEQKDDTVSPVSSSHCLMPLHGRMLRPQAKMSTSSDVERPLHYWRADLGMLDRPTPQTH